MSLHTTQSSEAEQKAIILWIIVHFTTYYCSFVSISTTANSQMTLKELFNNVAIWRKKCMVLHATNVSGMVKNKVLKKIVLYIHHFIVP